VIAICLINLVSVILQCGADACPTSGYRPLSGSRGGAMGTKDHERQWAAASARSASEAESVFFNDPLIVVEDARHSETERRFNALGKTGQNRLLHITFTLRQNRTMIRVISARDMHRRERKAYEQA
jgi:uncharacterized DUF497 family protein